MDDGTSFDYENQEFVTTFLSFKNNTLTGSFSKGSKEAQIKWGSRVERVIILGLTIRPTKTVVAKTFYKNVKYSEDKIGDFTLTVDCTYKVSEMGNDLFQVKIKDPKMRIGRDWSLEIEK